MKRLNHLVLWSITVLASVGLAGLFIFPASWVDETYDCNLGNGLCSLVEEWNWAYTCTSSDWGDWIRCTSGEQQLNFCENHGWGHITCYHSYTRRENNGWWYYFEENASNFSWNSYCKYPDIVAGISTQAVSMITCDYYGTSAVHYDSCKDDDGSIFCLANYDCDEDEWWYSCIEEAKWNYNCELKDVNNLQPDFVGLDEYECSYNWEEEEPDFETCYSDPNLWEFFCPYEYSCENKPGWAYCSEPYEESDEVYYCMDDSWFPSIKLEIAPIVWSSTYKCFTKSEWKQYEGCVSLLGWYYCPETHSCEMEDEWYHCEKGEWEYTCYPDFSSIWPVEAAISWWSGPKYICKKPGEQITNCQVEYEDFGGTESLGVSEGEYSNSYFFCPTDKYNCHNENGLKICNPSTTWNYSCSFPQGTTELIEGNHALSEAYVEYAVCANWTGDYMDNCFYYDWLDKWIDDFQSVAYVSWWYPSMWYYVCPIKYNCDEIKNWRHVCSQDNTEWDFYCRESYWWGGKALKASELIMWDYTCAQPQPYGTKWYDNCIFAENKFYCDARYSCTSEKWWYQCNVDDDWEYKCKQPTVFLDTTSSNYICSGPNTYNNCEPNKEWYFCPATVELKLYLWGCVNTGTPTVNAVAETPIECDGAGYLWAVLISKDSWVSVNTLFTNEEVRNKLPAPEAWMEWVWYLGNSQNADKLSESTQFSVDSKLYVFQDERKIGTIRFNSDWWTDVPSVTGYYNTTIQLPSPTRTWYNFAGWYDGNNKVSMLYTIVWDKTLTAHWTENKPSNGYSGWGGSSRPSSKWSWPSTTDVKSVEKEPTTPAKEVKAEPKPVVPWKWANSTGKVNSNQELFDAYKWAYDNGLTKYANMSDARMDDLLNRQEMAKISTIFATKFQWETPNEKKRTDCSQYPDLWKTTKDMQEFIIQSCELGYMWYRANGVDYLERFRPYTPVSVAEVSIILSRIMWQNKYAISENLWYQWHLHAVYENNLLDNITKPFDYIARKDAYIMLYRISKTL